MDQSGASSTDPSRTATPNPAVSSASAAATSRFTSQNATAEDLLKSQTVGLVQLSDFRKRRAEALELRERGAGESGSGASTPGTGASTPKQQAADSEGQISKQKKKKRKVAVKGALSFGQDEDDDDDDGKPSSIAPKTKPRPAIESESDEALASSKSTSKKLAPNSSLSFAPKARTKAALLRDAQARETLRKEFLAMTEVVRETEIAIPFVFYDGTHIPGGVCRVKKGDHIWLFLDKARKVGAHAAEMASASNNANSNKDSRAGNGSVAGVANTGLGGSSGGGTRGGGTGTGGASSAKSKRDWARVSVDDLMLVRGEIIVPHHLEFHHFIVNKTLGFHGPLFPYSAKPTEHSPSLSAPADSDFSSVAPTAALLSQPSAGGVETKRDRRERERRLAEAAVPWEKLEGAGDDPVLTKVVDRRWFERNKHIFPASTWEEFDAEKDYSKGIRRDTEGNAFFF